MTFRDPRPYMVNLLVYPNTCETTYGTPDSEVMLSTFMIGVVWLNKGDKQDDTRAD